MARKISDCRDVPNSNCTLTIAGEEAEVLLAAADHAVAVHGFQRTSDLESKIRKSLKDEVPMQKVAAASSAKDLPARH